jgi:long-chain acyl-CoA synthetase
MLNDLARARRRLAEPVVEVSGASARGRPLAPAVSSGSLADIPFDHAGQAPDAVLVRRKQAGRWVDVTARELAAEVSALARGLLARGLPAGGRVALMARTSYEWMLFDLATFAAGGVVVPIYPTSAPEQARWILTDSDAYCCVTETRQHAALVAGTGLDLPVWCLEDGLVEALRADGEQVGADAVPQRRAGLTPDTTATIIYTSGTTGMPRGCVLTHRNLLSQIDNQTALLLPPFKAMSRQEPATLLFLPLAHVLGRSVQLACLRARVVLGHCPSVQPEQLRPELASFRPTFLVGVPYVYEKIRDAGYAQAAAIGKTGAFQRAAAIARRYGRLALEVDSRPSISPVRLLGLRLAHRLYDLLVYRRIRAALGGRVRYAISGGSALSPDLIHFFAGAGITIYEGYGLTETFAAATVNPPMRPRPGTVGRPLPGVEVRIAADGEILLRGPTVFGGYHRTTEGGPDGDGWFHTGDLGSLDADGYLTITGRAKEILVTSSGKNVSPAPLEDRLRSHPLVSQCIVVGDQRPFVAALLTLDQAAVAQWRRHAADRSEAGLRAALQEAVDGANSTVSRAESIRAFAVLPADFTEDNGLLTPSLKLRRARVLETYAAEVDQLYATENPAPSRTAQRPGVG